MWSNADLFRTRRSASPPPALLFRHGERLLPPSSSASPFPTNPSPTPPPPLAFGFGLHSFPSTSTPSPAHSFSQPHPRSAHAPPRQAVKRRHEPEDDAQNDGSPGGDTTMNTRSPSPLAERPKRAIVKRLRVAPSETIKGKSVDGGSSAQDDNIDVGVLLGMWLHFVFLVFRHRSTGLICLLSSLIAATVSFTPSQLCSFTPTAS